MAKKQNASKRQHNQKHDGPSHQTPANNNIPETRSAIHKKIMESRRKHYNQESSTMLQFLMISFLGVLVALAAGGYCWYNKFLKDIVVTPLNVPKVIDPNASFPIPDPNMFWGSYRSGVYFGMKARSPTSPNFGLMWMSQSSKFPPDLRHWCNQGDELKKYGWVAHDGINFGKHEAVDHQFTVKSSFVKQPGGNYGGEWTAKIQVLPNEDLRIANKEELFASFFLYMSSDVGVGHLSLGDVKDRIPGIKGFSEDLGSFHLYFNVDQKYSNSLVLVNHLAARVPGNVGDLKSVVYDHFVAARPKDSQAQFFVLKNYKIPEDAEHKANFVVNQLTVRLPFEFEVVFESDSVEFRPNELSGKLFDSRIRELEIKFDEKFEKVFHLKEKNFKSEEISFAKATFSNLIGGIGYFHGASVVKSKHTVDPVPYWEAPLFTAVPSRSFFPRGFLWDEGFHNLLIGQWSLPISMDIMGHWFDLMNVEGWIPREQILGSESRARVPEEFVVQNNENANPPTMFLTIDKFLPAIISSKENAEYLQHIYPRLTAWYNWYNKTQQSLNYYSAYYWRGRNSTTDRELNPKTLTSGLDDYPRASHPDDHERHLDLRCWMAYMSRVLRDIAKHLGNEQWKEYERMYKLLSDNKILNELHWSESKGRFSDYGLHTDMLDLKRPPKQSVNKNLKPGQSPQRDQNLPPPEKVRAVHSAPVLKFVDSEFGYVNLFPFLLQILEPNSPQLGKVLVDLSDPELLWTPYGLRSLAKISPMYGKYNTEHDPPYWRGAIWININYLAVAALKHYSVASDLHKDLAMQLYENLRLNLIRNIYEQYVTTGYIWEQYDDVTGKGKGSHPFTGWSSLVVLIMSEEY